MFAQSEVDAFEHLLEILAKLVVPEAHNAKALSLKKSGAQAVVIELLLGMLASIQLNDQSGFEAAEVHYVGADRMLAAELDAQCTVAKS